jgi:hypothetical protein
VRIPRNFIGPITFKNGNGSTSFSPAIEAHLTVFSQEKKISKAFLGDWATAGYGEAESSEWEGDELEVESKNGSIRVSYVDEEEVTSGPLGWIAKLFGGNSSSPSNHPGHGGSNTIGTPTAGQDWSYSTATGSPFGSDTKTSFMPSRNS